MLTRDFRNLEKMLNDKVKIYFAHGGKNSIGPPGYVTQHNSRHKKLT